MDMDLDQGIACSCALSPSQSSDDDAIGHCSPRSVVSLQSCPALHGKDKISESGQSRLL